MWLSKRPERRREGGIAREEAVPRTISVEAKRDRMDAGGRERR